MRGTLKTAALEHYFPLLAVEHDCILSKNAEVPVAYRVVLPELFTLTGAEYEALHGAWLKALRVLPDYTIVHKQDYFTEEHYRPDLASDESFLGRAFERHFNERPFLRHSCYLFVTKTSKEQMRRRSDFSSLCRGFIVPQEIRDTESVTLFLDAAEQMRRILCDAGFIRLEPLTADEIVGTADDSGLIARYFALGTEGIVTNEDLRLDDGPAARTAAMNGSRRIAPTAASRSLHLRGCCSDIRTSTTNTFFWTTTPRRSKASKREPAT